MQKLLVSIVIVAVSGQRAIDHCLRSLATQCGDESTEVIAVGCADDGVDAHLAQILPGIRITKLPQRAAVPYMRRLGWQQAAGDVIAFTEDHCVLKNDWVQQLRRRHQTRREVIGGSIQPCEEGSPLDTAVFFCEYSPYLDPAAGAVDQLPGNNVSYPRQVVEQCPGLWDSAVWETSLHQKLQAKGIALISAPELVVYFRNRFRFGEFL